MQRHTPPLTHYQLLPRPSARMKLLILLVVVAVAAAQDCAGPIADFGDCISAAKAEAGHSRGGHKEGFATCFTDK